jgi:hypothetical protein
VEAVVHINIDGTIKVRRGHRHDEVTPHLSISTHLQQVGTSAAVTAAAAAAAP